MVPLGLIVQLWYDQIFPVSCNLKMQCLNKKVVVISFIEENPPVSSVLF